MFTTILIALIVFLAVAIPAMLFIVHTAHVHAEECAELRARQEQLLEELEVTCAKHAMDVLRGDDLSEKLEQSLKECEELKRPKPVPAHPPHTPSSRKRK